MKIIPVWENYRLQPNKKIMQILARLCEPLFFAATLAPALQVQVSNLHRDLGDCFVGKRHSQRRNGPILQHTQEDYAGT